MELVDITAMDTITTTCENLSSWIDAMSKLTSEFTMNFEATYGYDPGENCLVAVVADQENDALQALSAQEVPSDLIHFYRKVKQVQLPDVGNGIFVNSAEDVVDGLAGGSPQR